jgi:hypothetical protein
MDKKKHNNTSKSNINESISLNKHKISNSKINNNNNDDDDDDKVSNDPNVVDINEINTDIKKGVGCLKKPKNLNEKNFNSNGKDNSNNSNSNNNNNNNNSNKNKCNKKNSTSSESSSGDSLSNLSGSNKGSSHHRRKLCNLSKINRKAIKKPLPCLLAWIILVSATGSYYALVAPELYKILDDLLYWIIILAVQSIIFFYVIVNFLIAIFRDPGRFQKIIISPDDPNYNDDTKSPLYKTISINKTNIKIKWCSVSFLLILFITMYTIVNFLLYNRPAIFIGHQEYPIVLVS